MNSYSNFNPNLLQFANNKKEKCDTGRVENQTVFKSRENDEN